MGSSIASSPLSRFCDQCKYLGDEQQPKQCDQRCRRFRKTRWFCISFWNRTRWSVQAEGHGESMFRTKSYRKTNLLAVFLAALTGRCTSEHQIATGGVYKLDQAVVANGGGQPARFRYTRSRVRRSNPLPERPRAVVSYSARGGFGTQQFVPTAALSYR